MILTASRDTLLRHSRSHQIMQKRRPAAENVLPDKPLSLRGLDMSYSTQRTSSDEMPPQESMGIEEANQLCVQGEREPPSLPQSMSGPNHTAYITVDPATTILSTPAATLCSADGGGSDSATQHSFDSIPWESLVDPGWESWLTGVDFDLDAVNMSLYQATFDPGPLMPNGSYESNIMGAGHPETSQDDDRRQNGVSIIQRRWHTYFEQLPSSGTMTPNMLQGRSHIDETYRGRLTDSLRQSVQSGILPSTEFLVCSSLSAFRRALRWR